MIRRVLPNALRLSCVGLLGNRRNFLEIDPFKVDDFTGRDSELNRLKTLFEHSPSTNIYLLHGPPSCGKSRLVRHYLEGSSVPYLDFDLRGNRLLSTEDLLEGIRRIADSALETDYLTEIMSKTATKHKMSLTKIKLTTEFNEAIKAAEERLKEAKGVMDKLYSAADSYDKLSYFFEGRTRPLLFFLDDVNRIKEIVPKYAESTQAFRDLISCLLRITKQERLGNALMATVDPVYNRFLHSLGFPVDHFYRMTMGYLGEKEMKTYLKSCCPGMTEEIADIIWRTVGGSVQHFMRYSISSEFENKTIKPEDHEAAAEEAVMLHYSSTIRSNFSVLKSAQECEAMTRIYRELALSKDGALDYDRISKDVGKEVVDSLIDAGGIYMLAGEYISSDRKKDDDDVLIVPNSPLDMAAMKKYFANIPA